MESIIVKWVGTLLTGLKLVVGGLVGRVMAYLGFTWVNFHFAMPKVKSWLLDQASGLSDTAHTYLSAFGVDIFMTLIISAVIARVGLRTIMTSLVALESLVEGTD